MTTPSAGSRPAGTSQKLRTVFTPMPISDGHFTSGVIVFGLISTVLAGALRAGVRRFCAATGAAARTATIRTVTKRRICSSIASDDRVELTHAFGQRRRSGLENVGG